MEEPKYISDFLVANAKNIPNQNFLICPDKTLTWQEVYDLSSIVAGFINNQFGGQQQKIVSLILPDTWQFVVASLGVTISGNICLPIDMSFKKLEVDSVLESAQPQMIIACEETKHLAGDNFVLIEDILKSDRRLNKIEYDLPPKQQLSSLFLSSGTTGKPKSIPNTHANQLWDVAAIAGPMGWTNDDTLLLTLHLSHRHGLIICLLSAIYHGSTVYLEERFNPARVLEFLESGKISMFVSVPAAYEKLVEFEPDKKFDLSKVRLFASGSSALPPYLFEDFKKRFGHNILDRYGTSETGSIAFKHDANSGIFDTVLEGVELRVEPDGEVALISPGLFPGYLNNQEATTKSLTKDGWWLTGDIGETKNGKLILKGRTKERINKSGYSIYPQDIEWALKQNKKIREVKVISTPVEHHLDDKVFAFYAGDANGQELVEYSKLNLPRSWRPDEFIKINEIPRNANGKYSLVKLHELLNKDYKHLL
ncbi:MAG TPA: class I adenylate-forming enzyme family protein [Candidatus Saccharimonadales bacterium]|nr:class I adenylate-forming enzyme family protein [Candidatus Saccharimonadales bacterium]